MPSVTQASLRGGRAPAEETASQADYNSQHALRPGGHGKIAPRRELQLPSCIAPPAAFLLAGWRESPSPQGAWRFSRLHDNRRANKMAAARPEG